MTDDIKTPKRPKRWLAFLLNFFLAPVGYVYGGATRLAIGFAVLLGLAAMAAMAWTLQFPPGVYASSLFRPEDNGLGMALVRIAAAVAFAAHAAMIVRPRRMSTLKAWLLSVGLLVALLTLALGWRFAGPYAFWTIPSGSMMPTLQIGDVILSRGARLSCNVRNAAPGMLVLTKEDETTYVRRIIAGPGQTVQMRAGRLIIDGAPVLTQTAGQSALGLRLRETLANGASYVVLDLGEGSAIDDHGPIKMPAARWYVLGDNRDNSLDSRTNPLTPTAQLCGVAVKVLYSNDKAAIGRTL